ncbi:hypothetical protein B0T13DRAFT_226296 [Neurospora crassa]|nr:hypothetical protein B0T13DRAFT_226296 [Neurospora crassa]
MPSHTLPIRGTCQACPAAALAKSIIGHGTQPNPAYPSFHPLIKLCIPWSLSTTHPNTAPNIACSKACQGKLSQLRRHHGFSQVGPRVRLHCRPQFFSLPLSSEPTNPSHTQSRAIAHPPASPILAGTMPGTSPIFDHCAREPLAPVVPGGGAPVGNRTKQSGTVETKVQRTSVRGQAPPADGRPSTTHTAYKPSSSSPSIPPRPPISRNWGEASFRTDTIMNFHPFAT